MAQTLSSTEIQALKTLIELGGSVLESQIAERNARSVFGDVIPGLFVYRKLEKLGFVFFTEEEPLDLPGDPMDGFIFTPEIYVTDEGRAALHSRAI